MSVSSDYSITTSEEQEFSIEQKATYGFTDDDLAPYTVAGLRKDAKKKGLSTDEIKKVIKQRRRVKVRKYSKNFRAREQQQMADMEVEIRVLNLRKQKLMDEKTKLMSESSKYKEMVYNEKQPIHIYHHQQQQQQQSFPRSNFLTLKKEPIDPVDLKQSSPCYSYYSPPNSDNFSY